MVKLIGMATPFDIPTYRPVEPKRISAEIMHEQFAPGCFDRSLRPGARCDVSATWNHDRQIRLGSIGEGSLRLYSDANGLRVELDLSDDLSPFAKAVRNHCVPGLSVGFNYCDYFYERIQGTKVRIVTEAQLDHVSILAYPHLPAFPGTWIRIAESRPRGVIEIERRRLELEGASL